MNKKNSSKISYGRRNSRKEYTEEQIMDLKMELRQLAQRFLTPLPDEPDFATCDETLTRFLVARNYVVQDAFKQLTTAVEWRREFKPLTTQCKWCHETPGFHSIRQVGFDLEGRPVMYASFVQCQTLKNNADDVIYHMVYLIENARRSVKSSMKTLIFIVDCTGLTIACCNPKIGSKFIQTFADCYPETLCKFILINHNPFFHGIWKAIRVFIDPNTVKKVKLIKKEKIQKTFDEMFDKETVTWLMEELQLNRREINENQLRFWELPKAVQQANSCQLHDPRGTPQYIQNFIEPLEKLTKEQNNQKSEIILSYDNLGLKTHLPHPNVMDILNKCLKQTKITALHSGKCNKLDKEELKVYGINSIENVSEISEDGSEE
ncbi:unnamed protein product [Heterobilharzia americana]|nr:unnamed protein product [Heterobilharzia americana]CAH8604718.1 unnamed protein product [Heterobilharzia americana]